MTFSNDSVTVSAPNEAVSVLNADGDSRILLVCEHASRHIPAELDGLGLSDETALSHAAWDIGALELAKAMSTELDAPLVMSNVSRLVYDCNRPPHARGAMPDKVEQFIIPGNENLTDDARAWRVAHVYEPFRAALTAALDGSAERNVLVTVHSFTPIYFGQHRSVELGLLHDSDARLAEAMNGGAARHTTLKTALNQPYGPEDGVTHTLREHALPRGLLNVMIEVRNDMLADPVGRAVELVGLLGEALESIDAAHKDGAAKA
ncbi:N-formylglutamate amidohydrolase [Qingshengfaniella alkalisoli]|uniref:N-formylglutamate amidohydrolase n=1 Tax=Qingshengfaniella alkalisoli TaxID=2599296 RepID=A0A5B8JB01_9RHOB|nr:N-formylglutamate amidohydrolase [Qingshengfaniella alkalisoli]QDY71340.1 N-formylglutamate amidohydrolase [Qingshengfaniella alkalisoli]